MCHVCPPLWAFSDLEKNFNVTVRIGSLRLSHIFSSFNLVQVAKCLACVRFYFRPSCQASGLCSVLFSVPGIYVETYVYDDVYVRLLMTSYLRQMSHHIR